MTRRAPRIRRRPHRPDRDRRGCGRAAGGRLRHVKAHGALYNEAVADPLAAAIVLDAIEAASATVGRPLAVVTQPGGELARLAAARGARVIAEGFVDRAYDPAGRLVPRSEPGAMHHDPDAMVVQALDLANGQVRCIDGSVHAITVESLCVHGETPGAVAAARAVRAALERQGWVVAAAVADPSDRAAGSAGPRADPYLDEAAGHSESS